MLWVVAPPGVQTLPVALLLVKVTLPPAQNVVGPPAVTVGVAGKAFTVTTIELEGEEVQPPLSTTTTGATRVMVVLPLAKMVL